MRVAGTDRVIMDIVHLFLRLYSYIGCGIRRFQGLALTYQWLEFFRGSKVASWKT